MRKNLDQLVVWQLCLLPQGHVCVLTKRFHGKHFCQCENLNSNVLFLKLNGRRALV